MKAVKTLGQFIIEKQADFPYAKGEFSRLLELNVDEMHQRSAIIIGSVNMVSKVEELLQKY